MTGGPAEIQIAPSGQLNLTGFVFLFLKIFSDKSGKGCLITDAT